MRGICNNRQELFARNIAKGLSLSKAYALAGYKPDRRNAHKLYTTNHTIQNRVKQLMKKDSSNLSQQDILDHVYSVFELAYETQQASASLKALEMLGKEKGMWRDRREVVSVNLGSLSWPELEQYIRNKYPNNAEKYIAVMKPLYSTGEYSGVDGVRNSANKNNLQLAYDADAIDSDND